MLTCSSRISATLSFPIKVACWLERSRSSESAAAGSHPVWLAHNIVLVCVAGLYGDDNLTVRFAALCRSARPRRYRDAARRIRSELEFALVLRLGEKTTGQLQNFIGTAKPLVLTVKRLDAFTLVAADAFAHRIQSHFFDTFLQGKGHAADLGRYGFNSCPQEGIFATVLAPSAPRVRKLRGKTLLTFS